MTTDPDTPTSTRIDVARILVELEHIKNELKCLIDYDHRITRVERVTWMLTGVGSLIVAIFVPLAVAAIRKWVGI